MNQEDIIRMARETGVEWLMHNQFYKDHLQRFADLVAAAEREECAKVCENPDLLMNSTFQGVAEAIRASGRNIK